jgi:hypothetical protein
MAYKLFWHQPQRVIYFEIIGHFTKEEMYEFCYRLRDEFLSSVNHDVHILIDTQSVQSHPQDLRLLRDATDIYGKHENLGWMLFLGIDNPITKFLTNVLFQVVGTHFRTVENLEAALELLRGIDDSVSV